MKLHALCVASTILMIPGHLLAWERGEAKFENVEAIAKKLSEAPYQAPNREALPGWMKNLTYDQYRDIRFVSERSLWTADGLPFRAQFFHPGYLFREPVIMHEFTSTHRQELPFTQDYFQYGQLVPDHKEMMDGVGYAGFKILANLSSGSPIDETCVFQGASYWRALGKGQRYGLSSRGLALDTGAEGVNEEFPSFRRFWLEKPQPGATSQRFFALLDSPSVAGAYHFTLTPGENTVMEVRAILYPRKAVKRFGVAPLSSMYWFGENSKRRFDDFRPEVHDSDGLAIKTSTGEKLWRPLTNDSGKLEFSFLTADDVAGFGLCQRDRRFAAYEDGEASYHLRPTVWIEPTNAWGKGKVMLYEIPTTKELDDNIVITWVPDETPQPGKRYEFNYRQYWTLSEDPAQAGGHVVATRTGVHEWEKEKRTVIVEFAGGKLNELKDTEGLEAVIELSGDAAQQLKIPFKNVQQMEGGRWRVSFLLAPAKDDGKLADVGSTEMRCTLKKGEDFLTETWIYRLQP